MEGEPTMALPLRRRRLLRWVLEFKNKNISYKKEGGGSLAAVGMPAGGTVGSVMPRHQSLVGFDPGLAPKHWDLIPVLLQRIGV